MVAEGQRNSDWAPPKQQKKGGKGEPKVSLKGKNAWVNPELAAAAAEGNFFLTLCPTHSLSRSLSCSVTGSCTRSMFNSLTRSLSHVLTFIGNFSFRCALSLCSPCSHKLLFAGEGASDQAAAAEAKKPCWYFSQGTCTKGDACPFAHVGEEGAAAAAKGELHHFTHSTLQPLCVSVTRYVSQSLTVCPTRLLCVSLCLTQSFCVSLTHSVSHSVILCLTHSLTMGFEWWSHVDIVGCMAAAPRVCSFFLRGTCTKGDACVFSHEAPPGVTIPDAPAAKPKRICTFFLRGACTKGDDCVFSHGVPTCAEAETARMALKLFVWRWNCFVCSSKMGQYSLCVVAVAQSE